MWIEIICGMVVYKFLRLLFGDDDVLDLETSNYNSFFGVASRLEKLYGGKTYVGLRIPDADSGSRQNIDLVLVTNREIVVVCVKNMSGLVSVKSDGTWLCASDRKHKEEHHPDPVAEVKRQASILEAYLEQRGVSLPEGYLSSKVIISNPKFRTLNPDHFPPEVVQYEQWVHLKPESKGVFSGWIRGAFRVVKKDVQDSTHQKIQFVLSTAPMWDRLEIKGSKYVLGEFLEFKGKQEDLQTLQYIKRSKVSQMIVHKTSMFGLASTKLQVLYKFRDYRTERNSSSEWTEVTVRSSTEVVFEPQNGKKVKKFKLSAVTSLTLSA